MPLIHAQTAAKQNAGLNSLIDGFIAQKARAAAGRPGAARGAAADAKAAVADHQNGSTRSWCPNAKGNERIGAALYDEKLGSRSTRRSAAQEIRARAEAEHQSTCAPRCMESRRA